MIGADDAAPGLPEVAAGDASAAAPRASRPTLTPRRTTMPLRRHRAARPATKRKDGIDLPAFPAQARIGADSAHAERLSRAAT